ncbi:hypothetical protein [Metabacillus endolithicus]|uniref:Uncharacterized protein n=1 Tax=Metabacillus endolithicus TaxID=1535204 RepID=A0ABW5BUR4_9BACI|nr:hypothetical protein [Metabacillus endolithicus]UPG63539.1 hypothetical protein MVE64_25400 [Metabacillus endolithicus]
MFDRHPFLFLACMIAGFALINVPLSEPLAPLSQLVIFLGELTVLFFSFVLIFHGILFVFGKK